jgi:hypothetical protein
LALVVNRWNAWMLQTARQAPLVDQPLFHAVMAASRNVYNLM